MTKRAQVWVVHEPTERTETGGVRSKFNLTPAAEYGDINILVQAGMSLFSTVPTIKSMREKLRDFSDNDYLLPVGDPALMMAAGAIAAEFNHGRIKVLRWDREQRRYIMIQVDTTGKAI